MFLGNNLASELARAPRLERTARRTLRSELPDGRFAWNMKRPLPDGRSRLVMTGVELIERIVPLIPPVYANLTRFHGVFAPTSRLRAKVVPRPEPPPPCPASSSSSSPPPPEPPASSPASTSSSPTVRSGYRLDWAALLKRVFAVDVMVCSRCDGPMKVIAFLEESAVVRTILDHLGLPAQPLPEVKAQAPPVTVELFEDT